MVTSQARDLNVGSQLTRNQTHDLARVFHF
jgi:hypothetical protein